MKRVCVGILGCLFCFLTWVNAQERIDPKAIDIVRDRWGVPHIFAKTNAEVAYGLGWAHCEDDFQTIQKCFLSSRSMLGMVTGRDGAMVDYVVHLLHLRELVDSLYDKSISPEFKRVLNGYSQGINAYGDSHPKEIAVRRLFPISPKDVLTYSVLQFAVGCGVDDAIGKIYRGKVAHAPNASKPSVIEPDGSNAFAFNSKKTADGGVYLAINTHHPLEGQVAWYEAHLCSEEGLNILGSLFPGSPVIFTGVNQDLAWTHTVNHPDRLDIYELEMQNSNSNSYLVDGQLLSLKEELVKLKIKLPGFHLQVKRKVYWSIYGPTIKTANGVFAIRTPGIMDIRGLEEWHRMNLSSSFHEFKEALNMQALPGYNVMYGDRRDTIYYLSNGKLPIRDPKFDWLGTLPGNTRQTLWTTFHKLNELPQMLNPLSGYLFNTNHSPFKASAANSNLDVSTFDPTMGYETHDNNRSHRFYELLSGDRRIDFYDFKKIKYDVTLPEKLSFPVNVDTLFMLDENEYPAIAEVIKELKSWDREGNIESRGAAIFAIAFYKIAAAYKEDPSLKFWNKNNCVQTLHEVKDHLIKNFGTTEVSLGEYQRLERGYRSLPLRGLPDVLAAMYSTPTKNGRVKGAIGDCYVAFAKYDSAGVSIETVNAYGASNHPGNRHYDDQMIMYQQQRTKKMTLDRVQNYQQAETIYHPQVYSRIPAGRVNRSKK